MASSWFLFTQLVLLFFNKRRLKSVLSCCWGIRSVGSKWRSVARSGIDQRRRLLQRGQHLCTVGQINHAKYFYSCPVWLSFRWFFLFCYKREYCLMGSDRFSLVGMRLTEKEMCKQFELALQCFGIPALRSHLRVPYWHYIYGGTRPSSIYILCVRSCTDLQVKLLEVNMAGSIDYRENFQKYIIQTFS